MRTILCFGDSNTWGDPPGGIGRFPWDVRWPGVLHLLLGEGFRIIEEGLPGRTTCYDDPFSPHRNGLAYFPIVLETHYPVDLLIIMLGTNDLKAYFNLDAVTIAQAASRLLGVAKDFRPEVPQILLVSPPHVVETDDVDISRQFPDAVEKSKALAAHYRHFAELNQCHFFDAASVAQASSVDGIHMDAQNHELLGQGLARKIGSIFEEGV